MDSVYIKVLNDLSIQGEVVDPISDQLSVGSHFGEGKRSTHELIAYRIILSNPRARLLYNEARQFDLSFAFAQFIWNISGSDELNAISFYNGKGIDFSDDGKTISGSSYGKRLFKTPTDRSQLESIVERLRQDPTSRRTFAAIFQPKDNVVMTRDVPCPIGVQYLLRNKKLHAITFMRSNSAAFVLPYNVFFFTMIQELIARELSVELGDYVHICSSLHYYSDEKTMVERALSSEIPSREPMKRMPSSTNIEYINNLITFDEQLRHAATNPGFNVDAWMNKAKEFDSYWTQVAYLLIYQALRKTGQDNVIPSLSRELYHEYRFFVHEAELRH